MTLSELLDRFRSTKEKFAVVINEYALVVGVITLSHIMITVMGDWVTPIEAEQQIIKRDAGFLAYRWQYTNRRFKACPRFEMKCPMKKTMKPLRAL